MPLNPLPLVATSPALCLPRRQFLRTASALCLAPVLGAVGHGLVQRGGWVLRAEDI